MAAKVAAASARLAAARFEAVEADGKWYVEGPYLNRAAHGALPEQRAHELAAVLNSKDWSTVDAFLRK